MKRCYYEVLQVDRSADGSEIKRAYRKLAMEFHPDRNPGDHAAEERFKEASEAYEVLSDPHKRELYDRFGHQALSNAGFHGFSNSEEVFGSLGDLFEEFFGGGFGSGARRQRRQAHGQSGEHAETSLRITFAESFHGVEREVRVERWEVCATCSGSGMPPGTKPTECTACHGTGAITQRQGFFMLQTTCPRCRGAGATIKDACRECGGSGRKRGENVVRVKVPAGVVDGMHLVLRGQGHAGTQGGSAGDLYVKIAVQHDARFERRDDDLISTVSVSFAEAALGTTRKVPSLAEAEITVKVPAGTQPGDVLVLRKQGFPSVHGGRRGDHVIEFRVSIPRKLSKKQKQLLEEWMHEE